MNRATIVRALTTSTARIEERADGVIIHRVLVTRTQTLSDARENTATLHRLLINPPRSLVVDIRIARGLQPGVREHYLNSGIEPLCSAIAFLVASPGSRQISHQLMSDLAGTVPLGEFCDEAEAIAWLHRHAGERPTFAGNAAF
jgi:hypothetical protein